MIDRLKGLALEVDPTHVIIQTGGVGFYLSISLQTYEKIEKTQEISLFTHLHVREDALQLYGFASREERDTFRKLIAVSGIGPRVAQALLSSLTVSTLKEAVRMEDWKRLTAAPGVGRKIAERMIIELRGVFAKEVGWIEETVKIEGYRGPAGVVYQAIQALVTLGYQQSQAEKLVTRAAKALGDKATVEELIRIALKP